ncbi:molybdate transport system substrate-binding protein [Enhydrobacter aerosaccus]|uniref:Molybdate transport system substrate-binding protein n=1 Tax=Enhydrobacter aerosaccus TaxID=225324 RepID=A0A1T4R1P1_9HYPH|nr:molybdate ABC transporter substrate-binding protein [Enhydrobacter aerosaccus]SKA09972.1 molybdate transport system substrate-binding protein [Enhydrobacter aerosaccus]
MSLSMKRRGVIGLALAAVAASLGTARAQGTGLVIFAAASLKNALDEIAAAWAKETGKPMPKISYAASSTLAKQMEQGAPADIFMSADLDWMDYAAKKDLIRPDTRVNLLGNKIVLIAPRDSTLSIDVKPGFDLAKLLGNGKLATGNVDSVPVGKYAKAALEKLGAWEGVKDKIAQAESVRAALMLVARGEAPIGIVYSTDAAAEPNVKIIGTFPADSHPPIIYPMAITKDSKSADAKPFLDLLKSAKARPAFEKQGFTVLVPSASAT